MPADYAAALDRAKASSAARASAQKKHHHKVPTTSVRKQQNPISAPPQLRQMHKEELEGNSATKRAIGQGFHITPAVAPIPVNPAASSPLVPRRLSATVGDSVAVARLVEQLSAQLKQKEQQVDVLEAAQRATQSYAAEREGELQEELKEMRGRLWDGERAAAQCKVDARAVEDCLERAEREVQAEREIKDARLMQDTLELQRSRTKNEITVAALTRNSGVALSVDYV